MLRSRLKFQTILILKRGPRPRPKYRPIPALGYPLYTSFYQKFFNYNCNLQNNILTFLKLLYWICSRAEVQDNWIKDKVRVICATIAFGMGIDKPGKTTLVMPIFVLKKFFLLSSRGMYVCIYSWSLKLTTFMDEKIGYCKILTLMVMNSAMSEF